MASTSSKLPPIASRTGPITKQTVPERRPVGRAPAKVSASRAQIVNFTSQLAIMLRTGVDLAGALATLARESQGKALAGVIREVRDQVLGGAPFSEAIRRYESLFGQAFVATVAAGEKAGRLAEVLCELARFQRSELRLSRTIRTILTYPMLLVSVASLIVCGLVGFVLPQFAKIFQDNNTPLPVITQLLLMVANEVRDRWWLWLPAGLAGIVGLVSLRVSDVGRRRVDYFLVHAYLVRDVSRILIIGRACRLLGMMTENGVAMLDSLRLLRNAMGNSLYRKLFQELETEVVNGRGLAQVLQRSSIVPTAAVEMIVTAERTGKIGEVANMIGEHFEEEAEAKLRQLVAILEPVITVVMGVIIAVIVLAVMLPMFDLSTIGSEHHS